MIIWLLSMMTPPAVSAGGFVTPGGPGNPGEPGDGGTDPVDPTDPTDPIDPGEGGEDPGTDPGEGEPGEPWEPEIPPGPGGALAASLIGATLVRRGHTEALAASPALGVVIITRD